MNDPVSTKDDAAPRNRAQRRAWSAGVRSQVRAHVRRTRHRAGQVPAFPMRSAFKGILPRAVGDVA